MSTAQVKQGQGMSGRFCFAVYCCDLVFIGIAVMKIFLCSLNIFVVFLLGDEIIIFSMLNVCF